MRALCGVCISGITVAFDCLIESVPGDYQAPIGLGIEIFWTGGTFFVTFMSAALLPRDDLPMTSWRFLVLACAFPILLACVGGFVLEESPAWLQSRGRTEDAMVVLKRLASKSGVSLDGITLQSNEVETEFGMLEVVKPPYLRPTFGWCLIWILGLAGYYGAGLASPLVFPPHADGSENYTGLYFGSAGELVGLGATILAAKFLGNNKAMILAFWFAAISIFPLVFQPMFTDGKPMANQRWVLAICLFVTHGGCMGATSAMYVGTPLCYPTKFRATAHGFVNMAGRFGGILAGTFSGFSVPVVAVIYGVFNVICAVCATVEYKALGPLVDEANLGGSIVSKRKKGPLLI